MKKLFFLLSFISVVMVFGQSKISLQQAERTTDIAVIAQFVRDNPNHPKTPELKRKMVNMMGGNSSSGTSSGNTQKASNSVSSSGKTSASQTASLLTHLFSNDPNRPDVYVKIINRSSCPLNVVFKGKKNYTLTVPASKDNYILIPKGTYTMSTMVCGARYSEVKSLTQDSEITLKGSSR